MFSRYVCVCFNVEVYSPDLSVVVSDRRHALSTAFLCSSVCNPRYVHACVPPALLFMHYFCKIRSSANFLNIFI